MEDSRKNSESAQTGGSTRSNSHWLTWTIQIFTLVVVALVGYNLSSAKVSINDNISRLQEEILKVRADEDAKLADISEQMQVVSERAGSTAQELAASKKNTEKLRMDQEKSRTALAKQLEDTTKGLTQMQLDTDSKLGAVNGDVKSVATSLDTARQDMSRIQQDLSDQIARNSTELADLRKKGDRDYVEFAVRKAKKNEMQHVANIQMAVTGTDPKRQKFDVIVLVDDHKIERKDRVANEPIQFLVGRDQLRYEVVVNFVDKDLIRGYVSTPKGASAEKAVALQPER